MSAEEIADAKVNVVTIPYNPRKHFLDLHASTARWIFVVAHRRAGKTVALVNQLIRAALTNTRTAPPPRYAYIGPSFTQTKDLAWGYVKFYTASIPGMQFSESELTATFPNGAKITLYGGASAYERMRGLYFDGVVMDEYAMLSPDAWTSVIRPTLSDYRGFALISGTSNGDDHFHTMKQAALADHIKNGGSWDYLDIKVNETDALHPDEVEEMRKDMRASSGSDFRFQREMMNSFDAPVEGAYYGELMADAEMEGRICSVPHDPRFPVDTWWDLGIRDLNAIWFVQWVGRELHVIDYLAQTGKGLDWYYQELRNGHRKAYNYRHDVFPHDIMARELGTGRSRYEVALSLGFEPFVTPSHKVEDGITAVRSVLPMAYFDREKTTLGVSALKSYKQGRNGKPLHDWASHGSDAFRHGSVSVDQVGAMTSSKTVISFGGRALRRKIKGLV